MKETDPANLMRVDHPFGWLLSVLQKEKSDKTAMRDIIVESMSYLNELSPTELEQRHRAIHYLILLILHRRPVVEHEDLIRLVDQHVADMEVEHMVKSMADVLREEGKTVGIALGLEQGKAEGEALIKQEAVLKLIQLRFGDVPESVLKQISSITDLSPLDTLFDVIWNADSLDGIEFWDRTC